MKKDNSEYEIDRELTGKFAIEKNAEYQEKIEQLEEENKKLKEKLDKLQDEYDELYIEKCNASNQWKCCEAENKELKDELLTYMRK